MIRIKRWALGSWLCTSLLLASNAHADVADIEECTAAGAACSTSKVPHGTCADGMRWSCHDDGTVTKYHSLRCETDEELKRPADVPLEPKPSCPDDEGCTIRQVGTERGVAAIFLALGLGALALARRRG